jgi:hypothetical protein
VEQALEATGISIVVPDGESLTVGPFEPRYFEAFRLAEVSTFEDLQRLGFVAQEIAEQEARATVFADDRAYRELTVQSELGASTHERCSCIGEDAVPYRRLTRRMVQTHLIDVLQSLSSNFLDAKNSFVIHTYHHLRSWFSKPARVLVGIHVLEDITIGPHATLTMTPTGRGLYVNDITIGSFGTLRFTSGAVHVRCNTLNGPNRFTNTSTTVEKIGRYILGLSKEDRRDEE